MTNELQSSLWGAWEIPEEADHRPATGGLAFDLTETKSVAYVPRWKIQLPADDDLAQAEIDRSAQAQAEANQAVDRLPERFDRLTNLAQRSQQISFGIEPAEDQLPTTLGDAEAEALRLLGVLEPQTAVSFGLLDLPREGWDLAKAQFQQAMDRLFRLVAYYAWVETHMGGFLLARTMVEWSGDLDTLWESNLTLDQYSLHKRSLSMAISSRNTLIRTFVAVTQGAVKLSALITTPGGAILALPVAWKYVNQILSEINAYKELAST